MERALAKRPPGDPKLVEAIVHQLKSGGKFDQFRKECLADVDTKPAFQNLQLRVESLVKTYLSQTEWKADLNKNQLRDGVRKHVQESGMLDTGIDTIINQVVNPKIQSVILPCVQESVYAYLDIDPTKLEEDVPLETRADDSAKEGQLSDAGGNIGHGPLPPPPGPSQTMPYAYQFPPQHPPPHHYPPQHFAPPAPHYPNHPQHPPVMMPPGSMDGPPLGVPPPIAPPLPIEAPPMMPPAPPMEAPPMPLTIPMDGVHMSQALSDPHFGHHPMPPAMDHLPPPITVHPPYPEPVMTVESPTEDSTSSDYARDRRDYRSDLSDSRQRPQTPVEAEAHSSDRLEYRSKHDDKRSLGSEEKEERREHRRRLINKDSPESLERHDSSSRMRLHESRRGRDVHESEDGYRVAKYGDTRNTSPEHDEHRSRREGEKHEHHRRKYEDYRRGPEEESRRKSEKHSHRSSKYDQRKHAQKHYEERRYDSPDTSMEYDTDSPHASSKHWRRGPYDSYGVEPSASQERGSHRSLPVHGEPSRQPRSPLIPMETDVISSEEDEILGAKSGSVSPDVPKHHPMVVEEDARDGFSRPASVASDTMESKVQQLSLQEIPAPLFDVQSLDSISSNSSGLSFSASKASKDGSSSLNASQSSLPGVDSTLGAPLPSTAVVCDEESIRKSSPKDNLLLGASPISAEDSSNSHCTSPAPPGVDEANSKPPISTSRYSSSPLSSPRHQSPLLASPRRSSPLRSCSRPPSPRSSSRLSPRSNSRPPSPCSPRPPSPPPPNLRPSPPASSFGPASPTSNPRPPSPTSCPRPPSPTSTLRPPSPTSSPRPPSPTSSPRPPSPTSSPRSTSPTSSPRPSSHLASRPRSQSPPSRSKPPSPPSSSPRSLSPSPLSTSTRYFPTEHQKLVQGSSPLAPSSPVHSILSSKNLLPSNLEQLDPMFTSDHEKPSLMKNAPPKLSEVKSDMMAVDETDFTEKTAKGKSTDPTDDHSVHRPVFGWRKDKPDDGSGDGGSLGSRPPSDVPSTSATGSYDSGAQEPSQPSQGQSSDSTKNQAMILAREPSSKSISVNCPYSLAVSVNQSLVKVRELLEVEITAGASQRNNLSDNPAFSNSSKNFSSPAIPSVSTCTAGTINSVNNSNGTPISTCKQSTSAQRSHINVVARPHHIPISKGHKTYISVKKDKNGTSSVNKKSSSMKKEMKAGHVPTAFENALLGLHSKKTSQIERHRRSSELDLKATPSSVTSTASKPSDEHKVTKEINKEKLKEEWKQSRSSSKNRERESSSSHKTNSKYNVKESTSSDGKHRKDNDKDLDKHNRGKKREKHSKHRRQSSNDKLQSENRHDKRPSSSTGKIKRYEGEKSHHKTDNHTDKNKHISVTTSESSKKTFSNEKSCVPQENGENITSGVGLTKVENSSRLRHESPSSKEERQSVKISQKNISSESSIKRKKSSEESQFSCDSPKRNKDCNHSQGTSQKNVSSESSKSKHSSRQTVLSEKIVNTVSRKRALASGSSSEDDERHLPMKKRFSKSMALTISTDDEEAVRFKRKIVKKIIDSSESCAEEKSEQKDEVFKPVSNSSGKSKDVAKENANSMCCNQESSITDSCSEDILPVKKRLIGRASKNSSDSDNEMLVQKVPSEPFNHSLDVRGNLPQPKESSSHCTNSEIISSDEDEVPLKKAATNKTSVQNGRVEPLPHVLVSELNQNQSIFKAETRSMSNAKSDSDSSDSFYSELMQQTCKRKNLTSTRTLSKGLVSQSLKAAVTGAKIEKIQKRLSRRPKKSPSRNISVTEEGVVITADHGKKILLCYDENSASNVSNSFRLFSSEDSDPEEFLGFSSVDLDYKQSSPVVVLEEMYDFVGFSSSLSFKAEKLKQYIERQKCCQKIYSVDDLTMTVTGDMFGPKLPMKVFLDAMVNLGAKVSGFHAFLANSPKNKSRLRKKKKSKTVSCSDSSDEEISMSEKTLSLDSEECEGVLSSENEFSHARETAQQVRFTVESTTSLPSRIELSSGAEMRATELIANGKVSSRSETVPSKSATPHNDTVLLTPPDDEYSEGSFTPPKTASPYAPLSPSTSDGSADTSGSQFDVVTPEGGE